MAGLPVTIRLLDPPIHEFLPTAAQLEFEIAHLHHLARAVSSMDELPDTLKLLDPDLHKSHLHELEKLGLALREYHSAGRDNALLARKEAMLRKVRQLTEVNPMLGHRGVRLGITNPEIYAMQIRAILEAAAACRKEGIAVMPEIMVPQVAALPELERVRALIAEILPAVEAAAGLKLPFRFGSMLEVVRACVRAGELAGVAEFFSFGTNDLTQATFSFSREDAENKFLPAYLELAVLKENPFEALDVKGVGVLMEMAVRHGREARPDLAIGICGEHGGHPESIRFCHHLGLDYVSCSAPRVPIARLAAAQARLLEKDYDAGLGD
jgi:pyruvate,orthophosphate dikinase